MPRFFLAGANLAGGVALLTGADAEHIKVLRMKLGEQLVVCDGAGRDYLCRLTSLADGTAEAEVLAEADCPAEPSLRCTILAGFPKGDKADFIVQKCTEGGAAEIVFFPSERCVSRPDSRALEKKCGRWQRIAQEAAKQSGRGIIPAITAADSFAAALDTALKAELRLFMYETGERVPICQAAAALPEAVSCTILTGPEGGFEPWEADLARKAGMTVCSMGARILRCETAPLVALTAVLAQTGNL